MLILLNLYSRSLSAPVANLSRSLGSLASVLRIGFALINLLNIITNTNTICCCCRRRCYLLVTKLQKLNCGAKVRVLIRFIAQVAHSQQWCMLQIRLMQICSLAGSYLRTLENSYSERLLHWAWQFKFELFLFFIFLFAYFVKMFDKW